MDLPFKTYTKSSRSGGKAKKLVLLLHGLGANGMDLLGLSQYWAGALPDAAFVSPDAPFPCDMAPVGFQWFSLQDRSPDVILAGVEAAFPALDDYIDALLAQYGLEDKDLALVGFSQGTMMSLYTGPRRKEKIAGILGYSGALIGGDRPAAGGGMHKPPVYLVHGEADQVVPVGAYHQAKAALAQNGFPVEGHTTPYLQHGIDDEGIEAGAKFLARVLS